MNQYIIYFEISAFVASLIALPVLRKKPYLLVFPFLLLVVVAVEAPQTFFKTEGQSNNADIYNIQVPVQHLLYLLILYLALEKRRYKIVIIISMAVFLLFTVVTVSHYLEQNRFNVLSYCAGSVFIVAGILMKFYEMLNSPAEFNFLKSPFFYLLFAFLFFNLGSLPYFAMGNWLYFVKGNHELFQVFADAMSILNYMLYATYTLVFLWIRFLRESDL